MRGIRTSVCSESIAVSISPGATELTRTPKSANSFASSRVREANAALDVLYADPANGCIACPAIEVIFTIEPFPFVREDAKPRAKRNGAKKLSSKTVLQASKLPFRHPSRS